jgi:hypothetical protein
VKTTKGWRASAENRLSERIESAAAGGELKVERDAVKPQTSVKSTNLSMNAYVPWKRSRWCHHIFDPKFAHDWEVDVQLIAQKICAL